MNDEMLIEKKVDSEYIFDGKLLQVYRDTVSLPNGELSTREYIKHQGAVAVVPVTDEGEIIAVRQYRYPIGRITIEIPAGKLDKGEDHLTCGKREFLEETGYTAEKMTYLGEFYPSVGFLTEKIHIYMAEGLKKEEQHLDEDEFLNVLKIPLSELMDMVKNNEIQRVMLVRILGKL